MKILGDITKNQMLYAYSFGDDTICGFKVVAKFIAGSNVIFNCTGLNNIWLRKCQLKMQVAKTSSGLVSSSLFAILQRVSKIERQHIIKSLIVTTNTHQKVFSASFDNIVNLEKNAIKMYVCEK